MKTNVIITLIHGTFARDAEWSAETSAFCKSIADGSDADISFERFGWSGRNNVDDRLRAADELANTLAEQRRQHPESAQIVVGHSHGGSVLAYLLTRHPAFAKIIAGAAFLATPFIEARPRPNWKLVAVVTTIALLFLLMVAVTAILLGLMIAANRSGHRTLGGIVLTVLSGVLLGFPFLVLWLRRRTPFTRSEIRELADALSTCRLPSGRYLFLRVTGDEASSALSTAQFSSWFLSKVIAVVSQPWFALARNPFLERLVIFIVTVSAAWVGIVVVLVYLDRIEPNLASNTFWSWTTEILSMLLNLIVASWAATIPTAGFTVFVAVLLFSALWIVYFAICWLSHRSFGRASLKTAMCIELVVENVPLGTHVLTHIPWHSSARNLSHRSTYQNPKATAAIRNWLNSVVEEVQKNQSNGGVA